MVRAQTHTRYPVVDGTQDDVVGFVHLRDLLIRPDDDGRATIGELIREVKRLPASKRVLAALSEMRRERHHLAVVVDEYGGTAGIVTLEDLIEELVGEIHDEYDAEPDPVPGAVPADVDGRLNLADFAERSGFDLPPGPYETVGGFVMACLGRLPAVGDEVVVPERGLGVARARPRRPPRRPGRPAPARPRPGGRRRGPAAAAAGGRRPRPPWTERVRTGSAAAAYSLSNAFADLERTIANVSAPLPTPRRRRPHGRGRRGALRRSAGAERLGRDLLHRPSTAPDRHLTGGQLQPEQLARWSSCRSSRARSSAPRVASPASPTSRCGRWRSWWRRAATSSSSTGRPASARMSSWRPRRRTPSTRSARRWSASSTSRKPADLAADALLGRQRAAEARPGRRDRPGPGRRRHPRGRAQAGHADGWPLYKFKEDAAPSDIKGEGLAGNWSTVKPDGKPVIKKNPAIAR